MAINDYPLHKAVFQNDAQNLELIIDKYDCSEKDKHGLFESFNLLFYSICSLNF